MVPAKSLLIPVIVAAAASLLVGCAETETRDDALHTLARWEDRRLAPADSLISLISDDDAHIRRAALRCAGRIGRTDALPALLDAMDDPSDAVKVEAALALGFVGDPAALEPLSTAAAGDHSRVRRAALFALARVPGDGEALWDIALHGEPADALLAWNALRDRAADLDSTRLADTIRSGLVRDDPDILWRVLRCAERSGSHELVPEIVFFTEHRRPEVRVHACRALAALAADIDDDLALDAALEAVLNALVTDRLSTHDADRVRIAAMRALGVLAPRRLENQLAEHVPIVSALTGNAGSANPHVARTALEAMAAVVAEMPLPPEAADRESLLPVWRIRLLQSARAYLVPLVDGAVSEQDAPEPVVRAAAVQAVCALRGAGLRHGEDWLRVVTDPAPQVRDVAATAVAAHVAEPDEMIAWAASLTPDRPGRALLAATAALPIARARYEREGRPDSVLAQVADVFQTRLRAVMANGPWAAASQCASLLGADPADENLAALLAAWNVATGWGSADIRLGVLDALAAYFPAPVSLDSLWAPADSLLTATRAVLEEGFDAPDIRQRLRARTVAIASALVPATAIPGEASLRATVPSYARHPEQAALVVPFDAPEVICRTDRGDFTIRLDGHRAPNTCATFLDLIRQGYFDGLTFHRVVPDFVIQGGDPDGTGWGGPGYSIRSEWSDAPYERGTVGIAHSGKDTGGSQFFVGHSPQPHLNGRYTVIGKVVNGMEIVDLVQPDDRFRLEIVSD